MSNIIKKIDECTDAETLKVIINTFLDLLDDEINECNCDLDYKCKACVLETAYNEHKGLCEW